MTLEEEYQKETGKSPHLLNLNDRELVTSEYVTWLKAQIPLREQEAFKAGWYLSSQVVDNSENICDSMLKEWKEATK